MVHFQTFTPSAMRNLAGEMSAELQRRTAFVDTIRDEVPAMLSRFRQGYGVMATDLRRRLATVRPLLQEQESERLQQAKQNAEARQVFASELKSKVIPLLERFRMEHGEMAAELRTAQAAFRTALANPGTATRAQGSGAGAETPAAAKSSRRGEKSAGRSGKRRG